MNRMEEYEAMVDNLGVEPAALERTLERAHRKRARKTVNMIFRPVFGLAACFGIFVLLVNFISPVSEACSQIPFLRELAEAVTFSKSLSDAIDNAYVQRMDLAETQDGITAEIEYLIVDQKQVHIFYRLDSAEPFDGYLHAYPSISTADGSGLPHHIKYILSFNHVDEQDALRHTTIDFVEGNVPQQLRIKLEVCVILPEENIAPTEELGDFSGLVLAEPLSKSLATFDFLLEFDPNLTASGKSITLDQTVILEGQEITVSDIEIYPSHMRINISESDENTAWLKNLEFYVETDQGMKFAAVASGITATGSGDSPSMTSYRADSTYFYDAERLNLVITGARWLNKDMDTMYLNLKTGETRRCPEGVELVSCEKTEEAWEITFQSDFRADGFMCQLFDYRFYDGDGKEYDIGVGESILMEVLDQQTSVYFEEQLILNGYPYDEVWLCPMFSHDWTAQEPITIPIQ